MSEYKIYPFYFPQLYSIPENDDWWGKGFTDWNLVKNSKAIFSEHYQPRTPVLGYLDQSLPSTIETQCELAKKYGVTGFNFYHYWFDGKVLLDTPVSNLLSNASIDLEFFFTWANENWTRQWVGKPQDLLIKNSYEHSEKLWGQHFDYLVKYFNDSRYTKVDGKPILCIYRPEIINGLDTMLEYFNKRAILSGFDGLHLIAMRAYSILNAEQVYNKFDAIVNFQPRFAVNKYLSGRSNKMKKIESIARRLPEYWQGKIASLLKNKSHKVYSYMDYVNKLSASEDLELGGKVCYQAVFPDWDNTPRYNNKATLFNDVSLNNFKTALEISRRNLKDTDNKFVFVNAWNEWSESAYLEPDEVFGLKKLEILKDVFKGEL